MIKKKISIVNPCYNEESNVEMMYQEVKNQMKKFPDLAYEHIFIDNCSTDNTEKILKNIAKKDKRVKCIFNLKNYGPSRSASFAYYQATGDAIIGLASDFQDPPELIETFIKEWKKGNKLVLGQRKKTESNKIIEFVRIIYYKIINNLSENNELERVTGFGLYDREVMDWLKWCDDPLPSFRHMIVDLGYKPVLIPYTQGKRKNGKSSYNFFSYANEAFNHLMYTSLVPLKAVIYIGFVVAVLSVAAGLFYLIFKLSHWNSFNAGIAPVVVGMFFLGSIQLISIGIVGEYVGSIFYKTKKRPKVIAKETINIKI